MKIFKKKRFVKELLEKVEKLEKEISDPYIGEVCLYGFWEKFRESDIIDRINDNLKIEIAATYTIMYNIKGEIVRVERRFFPSESYDKFWVKENQIIFYKDGYEKKRKEIYEREKIGSKKKT